VIVLALEVLLTGAQISVSVPSIPQGKNQGGGVCESMRGTKRRQMRALDSSVNISRAHHVRIFLMARAVTGPVRYNYKQNVRGSSFLFPHYMHSKPLDPSHGTPRV
jgi:hypothetical protein